MVGHRQRIRTHCSTTMAGSASKGVDVCLRRARIQRSLVQSSSDKRLELVSCSNGLTCSSPDKQQKVGSLQIHVQ